MKRGNQEQGQYTRENEQERKAGKGQKQPEIDQPIAQEIPLDLRWDNLIQLYRDRNDDQEVKQQGLRAPTPDSQQGVERAVHKLIEDVEIMFLAEQKNETQLRKFMRQVIYEAHNAEVGLNSIDRFIAREAEALGIPSENLQGLFRAELKELYAAEPNLPKLREASLSPQYKQRKNATGVEGDIVARAAFEKNPGSQLAKLVIAAQDMDINDMVGMGELRDAVKIVKYKNDDNELARTLTKLEKLLDKAAESKNPQKFEQEIREQLNAIAHDQNILDQLTELDYKQPLHWEQKLQTAVDAKMAAENPPQTAEPVAQQAVSQEENKISADSAAAPKAKVRPTRPVPPPSQQKDSTAAQEEKKSEANPYTVPLQSGEKVAGPAQAQMEAVDTTVKAAQDPTVQPVKKSGIDLGNLGKPGSMMYHLRFGYRVAKLDPPKLEYQALLEKHEPALFKRAQERAQAGQSSEKKSTVREFWEAMKSFGRAGNFGAIAVMLGQGAGLVRNNFRDAGKFIASPRAFTQERREIALRQDIQNVLSEMQNRAVRTGIPGTRNLQIATLQELYDRIQADRDNVGKEGSKFPLLRQKYSGTPSEIVTKMVKEFGIEKQLKAFGNELIALKKHDSNDPGRIELMQSFKERVEKFANDNPSLTSFQKVELQWHVIGIDAVIKKATEIPVPADKPSAPQEAEAKAVVADLPPAPQEVQEIKVPDDLSPPPMEVEEILVPDDLPPAPQSDEVKITEEAQAKAAAAKVPPPPPPLQAVTASQTKQANIEPIAQATDGNSVKIVMTVAQGEQLSNVMSALAEQKDNNAIDSTVRNDHPIGGKSTVKFDVDRSQMSTVATALTSVTPELNETNFHKQKSSQEFTNEFREAAEAKHQEQPVPGK